MRLTLELGLVEPPAEIDNGNVRPGSSTSLFLERVDDYIEQADGSFENKVVGGVVFTNTIICTSTPVYIDTQILFIYQDGRFYIYHSPR